MEDIFLEKKDLEELLKKKKMFEYETYKDYDIYDLFIDLLKDETIYLLPANPCRRRTRRGCIGNL